MGGKPHSPGPLGQGPPKRAFALLSLWRIREEGPGLCLALGRKKETPAPVR
jgi:hypothetical protein